MEDHKESEKTTLDQDQLWNKWNLKFLNAYFYEK